MRPMYCKLFASLYQGTLRGRANEILVFTNLLAHCDSLGIVDKHPRAIAEEVGLTIEQVREALLTLESPDEESRSPELGGARISRIDVHRSWGWQVVNHAKYSAIRNAEDRREQNRIAQEKWREKKKVSSVSQDKPSSANLDESTDIDKNSDTFSFGEEPKRKKGYSDDFERFWKAYPRKVGKGNAWAAWQKAKVTFAECEQTLREWSNCYDWKKDAGQFIPHPATWLNGKRWEDGPPPASAPQQQRTGQPQRSQSELDEIANMEIPVFNPETGETEYKRFGNGQH